MITTICLPENKPLSCYVLLYLSIKIVNNLLYYSVCRFLKFDVGVTGCERVKKTCS